MKENFSKYICVGCKKEKEGKSFSWLPWKGIKPYRSNTCHSCKNNVTRAKRVSNGLCRQCGLNPSPPGKICEACRKKARENYQKNRETILSTLSTNSRIRRRRIRQETIAAYGGKCACCGETNWEFLTIDHINGGGNKHRKETGLVGTKFYVWLKSFDYPKKEYRCLCMNCQSSRGWFGYCPHENK